MKTFIVKLSGYFEQPCHYKVVAETEERAKRLVSEYVNGRFGEGAIDDECSFLAWDADEGDVSGLKEGIIAVEKFEPTITEDDTPGTTIIIGGRPPKK